MGTMGWFDGNPTSLSALPPQDEAKRLISLLGGIEVIKEEIEKSISASDFQWALQLVDRLIFSDQDLKYAKSTKAKILRLHAENQINCPTRHYYIQCAKELENEIE